MTDESWKCTNAVKTGWKAPDYSNQDWPSAVVFCNNTAPILPMTHIQGIAGSAEWIWVGNKNAKKDLLQTNIVNSPYLCH